jgi:hypothetical protein
MTLDGADARTLSDEASAFAETVVPKSDDSDDRVDHGLVAEYAFYRLAYAELEIRIETSQFAERVFELREKNREALEDVEGLDSDDPVEVFERAVEPYLLESVGSLESKIGSTNSARLRKIRSLRKRRDQVEETLERLRDTRNTYETRRKTLEILETQCIAEVRRQLSHRIDAAEDILTEQESTLTELNNHRRDLETKQSQVIEQLTTGSNGRIATVPFELESVDDLSRETIENAEHLYHLIDAGVLSEEALATYVHDALEIELEEPLEDTIVTQSKPGELLVPITHSKNERVFDDSSVQTARKGRDIHTQLSVNGIDSPFTISLVTLFDNIELDNASEFRHISEHWREDDLEELFGEEVDLWPQVAYPELFSPGEPVALPSSDQFVERDEPSEPLVEDGGEE